LLLLGIMLASASEAREQVYVSPDRTLVAMVAPAGKKKDLEGAESRIEVRSREGSVLLSKDFSSEDGEHGAGIVRGQWTSDSRFFVFLTAFSGGHSPLQHPIYFYCRRENTVQMLDPILGNDTAVGRDDFAGLTRDFFLVGSNTVVVEAQDARGTRRISAKLGTVPCGPIATCYRLGSPHRTVAATEYSFREDINPQTLERKVYAQRREDKEPRLVFTHSRSASECVGPSGRRALINSFPASKTVEVYVADLSSGRSWRIDEQAMELYQRHAMPDRDLMIVPDGEDMSPDDGEALVRMDLIYFSVRTPEEADKVGSSFKQWWYVVDTGNGKVLLEYRTPPPPRWW